MYPDIYETVAGEVGRSMTAVVRGWRRHALLNLTYPGAQPTGDLGDKIQGVVWLDISTRAVGALDDFEGSDYVRLPVDAFTSEGTLISAEIYAWRHPAIALIQDWDVQGFEKDHKRTFLAQYHR